MNQKTLSCYLRRCHICESVTEALGGPVARCCNCQKPMAPFYFFDDFSSPVYSDSEVRPDWLVGERRALYGFTASWLNDEL